MLLCFAIDIHVDVFLEYAKRIPLVFVYGTNLKFLTKKYFLTTLLALISSLIFTINTHFKLNSLTGLIEYICIYF